MLLPLPCRHGCPHQLAHAQACTPTAARQSFAHAPLLLQVWRHVNANAGALLQRRFGRNATQPFLQYCWRAGYVLTKRSYRLGWELFGPELNATASHRFRTYRPLGKGGDVYPLALLQHLALIEGLMALSTEYTYTVSALSTWPGGTVPACWTHQAAGTACCVSFHAQLHSTIACGPAGVSDLGAAWTKALRRAGLV